MAVSSSRTRRSAPVLRSLSPSPRFHSSTSSDYSSAFASSSSTSFLSPSASFFRQNHRSASPTRVNMTSNPLSPSVRFSIDRSISPNRSISVSKQKNPVSLHKKTCMCSPTTHPGSFRCSLHKNMGNSGGNHGTVSYPSNRLNMRRSAMTNSLVRIGTVEGEWVKRALTALIRPSSHQQRRREAFRPRPSRLSTMSKSEDL